MTPDLATRAQELRERLTNLHAEHPRGMFHDGSANVQDQAIRDLADLVCELAERLPKTVTVTASGEWHTTDMVRFSQLDREISGKTDGDK